MSNCVKFMFENYVDSEILASYEGSSEDAEFPLSNVFQASRAEMWRSSGHFEVVDGDNVIVFQEDGATDLQATVTAGQYSGDSAFFAAVESALETASTNSVVYTVSRDANTNKITIESDGNGGATLDLIWTDPDSDGMADLMGFDTGSDMSGTLLYSADLLRIHTDEWVLFDLGLSSNPTCFAFTTGGRNERSIISPMATIKLQGSHTNNFASPDFSQDITHRDGIFTLVNSDGLHTEALRFWRLKVIDYENALGFVSVAAIFLGVELLPDPRGKVQIPFAGSHIDLSDTQRADGGETFSEVKEKTWGREVNWRGLTKEEKEEIDDYFDQYGTSKPFFVWFDADNIFSTETRECLYAKFRQPPQFTLVSANNFECSFAVEEEI